jgi:hypothetical protein
MPYNQRSFQIIMREFAPPKCVLINLCIVGCERGFFSTSSLRSLSGDQTGGMVVCHLRLINFRCLMEI